MTNRDKQLFQIAKKENVGLEANWLGNFVEGMEMLWDVWIVDQMGVAKLLLKNICDAEWETLSKRGSLFRVPSGFLLRLLQSVDDVIEID